MSPSRQVEMEPCVDSSFLVFIIYIDLVCLEQLIEFINYGTVQKIEKYN